MQVSADNIKVLQMSIESCAVDCFGVSLSAENTSKVFLTSLIIIFTEDPHLAVSAGRL